MVVYVRSAVSLVQTPDFPRGLDDELQLLPLLVFRQQVALEGRGEAALRAEGEVLERHIAARFIDSTQKRVLRLELGHFAADQTENDTLVGGNETERFEGSRTLGLVLQ